MRILVVEDDPSIAKLLRLTLERDAYDVAHASNGTEALELFRSWSPDAVLLDLMLPDMNGKDVARSIREESDTPIVMVTALGQETDRVLGLDIGADDYIVKPFGIAELKARLRAATRRARGGPRPQAGSMHVRDLALDSEEQRVTRGDDVVRLTKREFEILRMLMGAPGRLVSRSAIAHALWGRDAVSAANLLDVHVSSLRRKLEDDPGHPEYIETVRGVGFRLRESA
jgi:DNA-binding response OmpR family regulator